MAISHTRSTRVGGGTDAAIMLRIALADVADEALMFDNVMKNA